MDNRPIGVFDSGLGGLTGVRELRSACRRARISSILAIPAACPTAAAARCDRAVRPAGHRFLLSQNVKCIMAACGTVSSTYPAAEAGQAAGTLPGRGGRCGPGSCCRHQKQRIGVIGTAATIRTAILMPPSERSGTRGLRFLPGACPLFVPLVENGYVDHSATSSR